METINELMKAIDDKEYGHADYCVYELLKQRNSKDVATALIVIQDLLNNDEFEELTEISNKWFECRY